MADTPRTTNPDPDAIVEEYLRRLDAGEQIDQEAYIAAHPEVAPALKSFFANEQLVRRWASDESPPASDTTPKDNTATIAPKSVAAAALAGPTGSIKFPAMMGRYRLEKELGRGAMGNVYLAHDTDLDRPVALKIPKFTAQDNQELIARFLREARAAAVLAHPNICRVYDVNEHQGVRYIAMEYIEGKPLSAFIAGGNVQPKQAASVIRKLALGLAEAHQRNILHRDLKPDNILVNKQGEPVLTDFGLARETTREKSTATQDGVILGSPAYMPPEQAAGNLSEMGPPSDIYSLGVVLYEMLTGDVPFRGSVVEVLASVLMKTPKTVREQKPEVDPVLAAICDKMMSKKAADRYPTMTAVAQALNDWLRGAGQQPAKAANESLSNTGEMKLAEPKLKLGSMHVVQPKQIPGAEKPKQTISPGQGAGKQTLSPAASKHQERTPQQLADLAGLVEQLLLRNDYLESIRIVEEIPDYQRTSDLRRVLGEAYDLKSKVEKLERNLEKYLNLVDIPELKKTVAALLKIHPGHPRGKEIKKALNTGGKNAVIQILRESGQYDPVGSLWEPKTLAAGIAAIAVCAVVAYFAVTIYIKNNAQLVQITIDDPTATVKIDGKTALISGQSTGEIKLTLGTHEYTVEQGGITVKNPQSFSVVKDGQNKLEIRLKDPKPAAPVAGTTPATPSPSGDSPPLAVAPFTADQAKAHQEAWAKHLGVPVEFTNSIGMKFRLIPPGEFLMGGTPEEIQEWIATIAPDDAESLTHARNQGPQHPVRLTKPFYLSAHEVTQQQYENVMGYNPAAFHPISRNARTSAQVQGMDTSNFPVDSLTWTMCQEFCGKLDQLENQAGDAYRLPTEAEWEFACRAGTTTRGWPGDTSEQIAAAENFQLQRSRDVSEGKPNPFGLNDMLGNMREWVQDWWAADYFQQLKGSVAIDPRGPETGERRSVRAGSWGTSALEARSALRFPANPDGFGSGFRVALSVDSVKRTPSRQPTSHGGKRLRIAGLVDGAEEIRIYPDRIEWNHLATTVPREIRVNSRSWPDLTKSFPNEGTAAYFADAKLPQQPEFQKLAGRGKVTFQDKGDHWYLDINDADNGEGQYAIEISWQGAVGNAPPLAVAPFDANQAKAHQEAWANHLGVPVEFTNSIGMKFKLIPPGEFLMGSAPEETQDFRKFDPNITYSGEQPKHRVQITKPFYLSLTEVTAKQWKDVMGSQPWSEKQFPPEGDDGAANYVSWNDAKAFCEKLQSAGERQKYRLPTEAEWEMACRAGTGTLYYFGNSLGDVQQYAWNGENSELKGEKYPHRVAQKPANPYGLFDITGNLWEWCHDLYDDAYYKSSPTEDPAGPAQGAMRVLRGGAWVSSPVSCRSAHRDADDGSHATHVFGFRVVLPIEAGQEVASTTESSTDAEGAQILSGHGADVYGVAAHPDGRHVVSAGWDGTVRGWDVTTGREVMKVSLGAGTNCFSIAISPDGQQVAVGGTHGEINVYEFPSGKLVQSFDGDGKMIQAVAFTADSQTLFSGSVDTSLLWWDLKTGKPRKSFQGNGSGVTSLAVTPDGREVLSGGGDGIIRVGTLKSAKLRTEFPGHAGAILGLAISPDGDLVASGGIDKSVRVRRLNGKKNEKELHVLQGHTHSVAGVAFLADGKLLVSGGFDKQLILWDLETGKAVKQWAAHSTSELGVRSVAVMPGSDLIVSGGFDAKVRLWPAEGAK